MGGRSPAACRPNCARIVDASRRCGASQRLHGRVVLPAADCWRATRDTHWQYAARLQREYPAIRVEADHIFCRDRNVWTSAGITAGIDLALALIEEDHGFAVAKAVAQYLVVYHRRHGGQSQFAASVDLAPKHDRIAAALGYVRVTSRNLRSSDCRGGGHERRQFIRTFRSRRAPPAARKRLRSTCAWPLETPNLSSWIAEAVVSLRRNMHVLIRSTGGHRNR